MKIIRVSNYDLDSYPQALVAEGITNEDELKIMLDALQASCGEHSSDWYRAAPDDYVLWRGMAEYV